MRAEAGQLIICACSWYMPESFYVWSIAENALPGMLLNYNDKSGCPRVTRLCHLTSKDSVRFNGQSVAKTSKRWFHSLALVSLAYRFFFSHILLSHVSLNSFRERCEDSEWTQHLARQDPTVEAVKRKCEGKPICHCQGWIQKDICFPHHIIARSLLMSLESEPILRPLICLCHFLRC